MNFRTFFLFILSLTILSGCTDSCKKNQNPPSAPDQSSETTNSNNIQEKPQAEEQTATEQAMANDASDTKDAVATAETQI